MGKEFWGKEFWLVIIFTTCLMVGFTGFMFNLDLEAMLEAGWYLFFLLPACLGLFLAVGLIIQIVYISSAAEKESDYRILFFLILYIIAFSTTGQLVFSIYGI